MTQLSLHEKEKLMAQDITLDGCRAFISGRLKRSATIWRANNIHYQAQFAWSTIQHVIENKNGQFKSR